MLYVLSDLFNILLKQIVIASHIVYLEPWSGQLTV